MKNFKTFPKQVVFPINLEQEGKIETIEEDVYRTRFISNLQIDRIDINKDNPTEDTSIKIIPRPSVDLYDKRGKGGYITFSEITKTINNVKEFLKWDKYDIQAKDKKMEFSTSPNELNEKLNEVKIYLIVKPIQIKPSKFSKLKYAILDKNNLEIEEPKIIHTHAILPINNFDNENNQPSSRLFLSRDLIFQHKAEGFFPKMDSRPSNRGNRPYYFNRSITTDIPYEYDRPYQTRTTKPEDLDIEDILGETEGVYNTRGVECQIFYESDFSEEVNETREVEPPPNKEWVDVWSREHMYVFPLEYVKSELDTSMFTNPRKYFTKTDKIGSKNIVPIFGSREEAEKLLLTVIEDLLQPFRRVQMFTDTDYLSGLYILDGKWVLDDRFNVMIDDRRVYNPLNLDYLDEPYVFAYKDYPPNGGMPINEFQKKQNSLAEKRKIKSVTRYVDHFENYDTTHELFLEPDSEEPIPTSLLTKMDTALLETAISTKIIEMGLGDFLELWYNNEKQNGEILYIPNSKNSLFFKSTLGDKKFVKNIHNYQKAFHKQSKRKKSGYKYQIKHSINNNS
uniref:Uncharacterized protein n=1 Tax=Protohalopteris sp. TaxID=2843287 RepID=A0A8F0F7K2_9PHAE|nr:hypothetical protein [Protohalopteris sp.]